MTQQPVKSKNGYVSSGKTAAAAHFLNWEYAGEPISLYLSPERSSALDLESWLLTFDRKSPDA
jgi:hypothetical protein